MLSTDGFQAALLCGLFFTASQLAAAGDAEAASKPLLKENCQLDKQVLGCMWVKGQGLWNGREGTVGKCPCGLMLPGEQGWSPTT